MVLGILNYSQVVKKAIEIGQVGYHKAYTALIGKGIPENTVILGGRWKRKTHMYLETVWRLGQHN